MTDHQILFDKLVYVDRLKRAGIDDAQARAHADAMDDALRDAVATKTDLNAVRTDIEIRLAQLETRLLVRIGGMIVAATVILIGVKFL